MKILLEVTWKKYLLISFTSTSKFKYSNINKLLASTTCFPQPLESIGATHMKHLRVTESPFPDIANSEQQALISVVEASHLINKVEPMTPNSEFPLIIDVEHVERLPQVLLS
ncbi:hypothetical protein O181_019366 [Austropuccinia psidii MF-1]|uniref:Uncharacterized protein n=1 Tax=Austropuccinia psidii MF-1 TaxID=1389203 RepID=A0A9Q3GTS9_9BASI|nr:hypothetical protein [Austropuccinia psidii MF-1]